MEYDFNNDRRIDQAATDGYKAGTEGKSSPPSKYATEDVLLAAWTIGNKQAFVKAASTSEA